MKAGAEGERALARAAAFFRRANCSFDVDSLLGRRPARRWIIADFNGRKYRWREIEKRGTEKETNAYVYIYEEREMISSSPLFSRNCKREGCGIDLLRKKMKEQKKRKEGERKEEGKGPIGTRERGRKETGILLLLVIG